jgi:hypothetical protein
MIASYSTEDCDIDELRPVVYNQEKGEFIVGKKINLVSAASTVSNAFSLFVTTLASAFESMHEDAVDRFEEVAEMGIGSVIDSCSSFVRMISGIASSEGEYLYFFNTNEKGEYIEDKNDPTGYKRRQVKITDTAKNIANSFCIFLKELTTQIDLGWEGIFGYYGNDTHATLKLMSELKLLPLVESISKFVDTASSLAPVGKYGIVNVLVKDSKGNAMYKDGKLVTREVDLVQSAHTIVNAMCAFVRELTSSDIHFDEHYIDNMAKVGSAISEVTENILAIDEDKLKRLEENTRAINRFANAVMNVGHAIDKLNGKKIDLNLNSLKDDIGVKVKFGPYGDVQEFEANKNYGNGEENKEKGWFGIPNNNYNGSSRNYSSIDTNAISEAIVVGFKKIKSLKLEITDSSGNTKALTGALSPQ